MLDLNIGAKHTDVNTHCVRGTELMGQCRRLLKMETHNDQRAFYYRDLADIQRTHATVNEVQSTLNEGEKFVSTKGIDQRVRYQFMRCQASLLRQIGQNVKSVQVYKALAQQNRFKQSPQAHKNQIFWEMGLAQQMAGYPAEAVTTWKRIKNWETDQSVSRAINRTLQHLKP